MTESRIGNYAGLKARINQNNQSIQASSRAVTPQPPVLINPTPAQDTFATNTAEYRLPSGNPNRWTVKQLVQNYYKIDEKDSRYQALVSQVAQLNGISLTNFPIPGGITSLKMPIVQGTPQNTPGFVRDLDKLNQTLQAINGVLNAVQGKPQQQTPQSTGTTVQGTYYPPQNNTNNTNSGNNEITEKANEIVQGVQAVNNAVQQAAPLIDSIIKLFK